MRRKSEGVEKKGGSPRGLSSIGSKVIAASCDSSGPVLLIRGTRRRILAFMEISSPTEWSGKRPLSARERESHDATVSLNVVGNWEIHFRILISETKDRLV